MDLSTIHTEALKVIAHSTASHMDWRWAVAGWSDLRCVLRRFLLLKYVQVLVLPWGQGPVRVVGFLASLHTALLLLTSLRVSRKASGVLLGQLAVTDVLLLLHWSLGALGAWGALRSVRPALACLELGLLASHHRASLLLLSCISLEALLVSRWPARSRRVRTALCARLASAGIWAATGLEFLVYQAVECWVKTQELEEVVRLMLQGCALLAPVLRTMSSCLQGPLWLVNAWVFHTIFCHKPVKRKSSFH